MKPTQKNMRNDERKTKNRQFGKLMERLRDARDVRDSAVEAIVEAEDWGALLQMVDDWEIGANRRVNCHLGEHGCERDLPSTATAPEEMSAAANHLMQIKANSKSPERSTAQLRLLFLRVRLKILSLATKALGGLFWWIAQRTARAETRFKNFGG